MNKEILIAPSYIASLRHYEKLIPHLKEAGFSVTFFLFGKSSMSTYCEENNLPYKLLINDQMFKDVGLSNIPVITPIQNRARFVKKLREFFKTEKPYAIISAIPYNNFRMQAMVEIANQNNIKTIVLQWALGPKENVSKHRFKLAIFKPKEYPFMIKNGLFKLHRAIVNTIITTLDTLKIGPGYKYRNYQADVYALITEGDKETRLLMGYPEEKLQIVGSLDVEFIKDMQKRLETDKSYKESLLKKYDLDPSKKNILIITTTFHLPSTTKYLDNEGQITYYEDMIKDIQETYPESEANIIVKIHPREQDIYTDRYKKYGAKVFGRESSVEELIILSDLYISHPLTSTNFSAVGIDKDAIIVNFSPLDFLDQTGVNFGIKSEEIVKDRETFKEYIKAYKAGSPKKQYTNIFKRDAVKNIMSLVLSEGKRT